MIDDCSPGVRVQVVDEGRCKDGLQESLSLKLLWGLRTEIRTEEKKGKMHLATTAVFYTYSYIRTGAFLPRRPLNIEVETGHMIRLSDHVRRHDDVDTTCPLLIGGDSTEKFRSSPLGSGEGSYDL